jgi:hypothetical protein
MRIHEITVNASAQLSACFDSPSTNDGSQGLFGPVLPPSTVLPRLLLEFRDDFFSQQPHRVNSPLIGELAAIIHLQYHARDA